MFNFTREYLVQENKLGNPFIFKINKLINPIIFEKNMHLNKYAKLSLEFDNDAKRRSQDEAISIHIITTKLATNLNIIFESQICGFHGKPDYIIRLGKKLYIMVSTTRAIHKRGKFDYEEAYRLMLKKINGLSICSQNLECLVSDVVSNDFNIRPILHILAPNLDNALLCIKACKKIINLNALFNIKIVITILKDLKYIS